MHIDMCIRDALFWEKKPDGKAACTLCRHQCVIGEGKTGLCGVRTNSAGVLKTLVYGRLVAERPDPVEKKPLFHFMPGTLTHSIATTGCNFSCRHCQNHYISQVKNIGSELPGAYLDPETLVANAVRCGAKSISYTYTEPTIFIEYALDVMKIAHDRGLSNIFVTNGFMSEAALAKMEGLLDAANVDLKSMSDDFYKKICGARLMPVMENIRAMKSMGIWVETTTLLIPGLNDSEEEIKEAARFMVSVDEEMPWHVTGFFPTHLMTDRPATPSRTLTSARETGLSEGLKFVYQGNRPGSGGEDTFCPGCGKKVISRSGYRILENLLEEDARCPGCGRTVPGRYGG